MNVLFYKLCQSFELITKIYTIFFKISFIYSVQLTKVALWHYLLFREECWNTLYIYIYVYIHTYISTHILMHVIYIYMWIVHMRNDLIKDLNSVVF